MMEARRSARRSVALLAAALSMASMSVRASADFEADLARIDSALRKNPSKVLDHALESCMHRRQHALDLYHGGQDARAQRSLRFCFQLLKIPETPPAPKVTAPTQEHLHNRAQEEIQQALSLEPDLVRGLALYRECAGCHMPEGWGLSNGSVPQIAGQHRTVVIKQLADIRAGNRDAILMAPYAAPEVLRGAQGIADVAGYIDSLEISVGTNKGPGDDLALGEQLYGLHCAGCHGENGEGNPETFVPRIQAQHFRYLVRQFEWIRDGKRRNANPEMVKQIQSFGKKETEAVLDWVSRLEPPPELQAPPGWKNPDFATSD